VQPDLPISVIVTTKNEEKNLARCLAALTRFAEIVVVDSASTDGTVNIAKAMGARVEHFSWNGAYPKKRQWCLDYLPLKYERIFFVDADEVVTPALCDEIARLGWKAPGYFVKGAYVWNGKLLKHGLKNNKLCLFDRRFIAFPIVDDLNIPGMGEMEGHYQPVLKAGNAKLGTLKNALYHYAAEDISHYQSRHENYARWEAEMRACNAYPAENDTRRGFLKKIFNILPFRAGIAFTHSYIVKAGFLDGKAGYAFARSRYDYYRRSEALAKGFVHSRKKIAAERA
jgi:glycosyltransferase involved in cell wall biosynthesis